MPTGVPIIGRANRLAVAQLLVNLALATLTAHLAGRQDIHENLRSGAWMFFESAYGPHVIQESWIKCVGWPF